MGHTLVAVLSQEDEAMIANAVKKSGITVPKIPFGRDCDRSVADAVLPYHITLFHWARSFDRKYLSLVNNISFSPCKAIVTGSAYMRAEEESFLLYLAIRTTPSFDTVQRSVGKTFGASTSTFLHLTLAASKERADILKIKEAIDRTLSYPFEVDIQEIHLYHIWNPIACRAIIK